MLEGCARELSPSRHRRSTTSRGAGCRLALLRDVAIMPAAGGPGRATERGASATADDAEVSQPGRCRHGQAACATTCGRKASKAANKQGPSGKEGVAQSLGQCTAGDTPPTKQ